MDFNTTFLIILWIFKIFIILFAIIAWRNLKWGVFLICAFLPSYLIRFKLPFDIPTTTLEIMILILFSIWIIKFRMQNSECRIFIYKHKSLIISIALFLVFSTFSIFISPDICGALGIWKAYFIEPLLFLIVFLSVIKKEDIKWVIYSLSFSAFYISIFAIGQKFFKLPIPYPWQEALRITSIYDYPNAVGLFLAPLIPLLVYQLIFKQLATHKLQLKNLLISGFLLITIILSFLSIYCAQSEGALVALFAGLLFYLFFKNKISRKISIGFVLIIIISSFLISNTVLFENVKTKLLLEDWSGMVRKTIWSETFEMLKDKPLGVGLNGYQTAIVPYHTSRDWMEIYLYPHNIFFNFWCEIGLLGLLSFIIIVILFYFENWKLEIKNTSPLTLCLMTSMTILLIHGLVDVPYFKNDLSILFWILIGFSLILRKNE